MLPLVSFLKYSAHQNVSKIHDLLHDGTLEQTRKGTGIERGRRTVLDSCSDGEANDNKPERVGACVLCGTQCDGVAGAPASKLGHVADNVYGFAIRGGSGFVESDGNRSRGCAGRGCRARSLGGGYLSSSSTCRSARGLG